MKRLITFAVIMASSAYYTCLPFVVTQADTMPAGDATIGSSSGTTIAKAPQFIVAEATDAVKTVLQMRVTAYASVPEETDDTPFITADGSYVADGIAASNLLPFGTRIKIPSLFGDKIFTIHDRMSPKIKNTIDIWMPTVKKAFLFGMEHASIIVLSPNKTDQVAVR